MTSLHYPCWPVQNGNLLCAIDLETTGTEPGYHEIIQIAIVPCTPNFERFEGMDPFIRVMAPDYPERADPNATKIHGLDIENLVKYGRSQDETRQDFIRWFDNLELAYERKLIAIAHNWQFEATFLKPWLGLELFDRTFQANVCDSMAAANFIRYHAHVQGRKVPFNSVNLPYLCKHFGIDNPNPHNAYWDAICGAKLFGKLCQMDILV